MRLTLVLGLLVCAAGCAASDSAGYAAGLEAPCHITTGPLDATPVAITREDPVDIVVTWQLEQGGLFAPAEAVLSLDARDGTWGIEVVLPMIYDDIDRLWIGTLTNPFGVGAPTGNLEILATAERYGDCPIPPSAAASIQVQ